MKKSLDFRQIKGFSHGVVFCHREQNPFPWLYLETEYVQQGGGSFWSTESNIIPVDDENFWEVINNPLDSFKDDFLKGLKGWVAVSGINRRKRNNIKKLESVKDQLLAKGIDIFQVSKK